MNDTEIDLQSAIDYIKKRKDAKAKDDDIWAELFQASWPAAKIKKAFQEYNKPLHPTIASPVPVVSKPLNDSVNLKADVKRSSSNRKGLAIWRANKFNRVFLHKSERRAVKLVMGWLLNHCVDQLSGVPKTVLFKNLNDSLLEQKRRGLGYDAVVNAVWLLNQRKFVNIFQPANKRYRYVQLTQRGRQWHSKLMASIKSKENI